MKEEAHVDLIETQPGLVSHIGDAHDPTQTIPD
jgi:hypothetical protein